MSRVATQRAERRRGLAMLGAGLGVVLLPMLRRGARAQTQTQTPREIEIVARRFAYTPDVVPLVLGETVTLLLRAVDFEHGFSVPELGIRADLSTTQVVRVQLTPRKAGKLEFLCDNFCGEGHEDMGGHFMVSESSG